MDELETFTEKLGRMTADQVDRALEAHDALEHELQDPDWNLRSSRLLARKITLKARKAKP